MGAATELQTTYQIIPLLLTFEKKSQLKPYDDSDWMIPPNAQRRHKY